MTHVFRKLGSIDYRVASERPKPTESYWVGLFMREDWIKVWLFFSSTSCRRIKTGTRMQEVDVYEVICDEVAPPAEVPYNGPAATEELGPSQAQVTENGS